ncbi:apolipoprotein N-acyltransferase [Chitinivorax sp. PXF-14]|uniref:apolipoprotein N-acyltransferase n=1 Tax=Chitinivorax sp. PXF-14 TaxID=3230488 RepID=UPI003465B0F4
MPRRLPPRLRYLLAFVAGLFCVFGFAPFYLFPIPVLGYAVLAGLLMTSASARSAAWVGFSFGLGYFVGGVSWVFVSLHVFGGMPAWMAGGATLIFCAFLAFYPALACWLSYRLARQRIGAWLLLAPALLGLSEWLRGWLFSGFPWQAPGYSQVPLSPLAGYAPLLGVYGITWLVLSSAFLLVACWSKALSRRLRVGLAILLLACWGGGAALRQVEWSEPVGRPISVALLQGNVAQDKKWLESELVDTFHRYRDQTLASRADLIVLPETALPIFLHQIPEEYLQQLSDHARSLGGDILVGVPEMSRDGSQYYNAVMSLGRAPRQFYRKSHLAPFGEYIPLKSVFGVFYQWLSIPLTDFGRGGLQQRPMQVAGQSVAVDICYEDVFGEEIIEQLPEATLLLNVTNDAWWGRSAAAMQHLQIAQMRSLETSRPMLRATNTGMTAIINHRGEVDATAPWFTRTTLTGTAQGRRGETPYTRWGNRPAVLLQSAMVLFGVVLGRMRLRGY